MHRGSSSITEPAQHCRACSNSSSVVTRTRGRLISYLKRLQLPKQSPHSIAEPAAGSGSSSAFAHKQSGFLQQLQW
jgi:hypothetical protein